MGANHNRKNKLRLDQLSPDQRYRALVESLDSRALYLVDLDGRVASWNPGAERLLGFSESEAKGKPFESFFCEEDRATGTPENILRLVATDERSDWEGWRIRKDGTRVWATATISAVRDSRGKLMGYAEVARDITQHHEGAGSRVEAGDQLRLLIDAPIDHAIFMLYPNGNVVTWNAGSERIEGYRAEEIIGHNFSCFYT
jgi:PAS domain S-box-containing protein